jgi:hypothetical protein
MRTDFYNLEIPAVANSGAALPVEEYQDKNVQVSGTFSGLDLHIEGTLDGSNWDAVTESIGTKDIVSIPQTLKAIRVYLTALTSGSVAVQFAGKLRA